MEKILVYIWHDCMECITKGLENYLNWIYRDKEVIILENDITKLSIAKLCETLESVDIVVASCSSFEITNTFRLCEEILKKKKWCVAHKPCDLSPEESFRSTKAYKWLKNINTTHVAKNHILDLNEKVKEMRNKPRLDS